MAQTVLTPPSLSRTALHHAGRGWHMVIFAAVLLAGAFYVPDPVFAVFFLAAAGALVALAVVIRVLSRRAKATDQHMLKAVTAVIAQDSVPSLLTDPEGEIIGQNPASVDRYREAGGRTLAWLLRDVCANPSAVLMRLQTRAEARGSSTEDIVTRRGHLRLSVHRCGEERFMWRLEDMGDRGALRGAEALSLPMMTVSKSGTVLFMNDALRRLVGGRVKSLDRVFNDLPLRPDGIHEIAGADGPLRARVVRIQGNGGRSEIFLIPSSVGQTVTREADIASLEGLPLAIVKLTRGGELISVNRLSRDLLGPGAAPGADLASLLDGLGRSVHDWLEEAASGRAAGKAEVLRASRQDKEVFLQVTLERMQDGDETHLVAIMNDATELKSLEAQFVQSQKMQAIGQLAGGIAHDFNNLLTAISGHCDLLLLRHDQGDPDYGDLMQINQNANRAASLVGQLLAFSRKQNLQPEVIDLRDAVSDLTHLLNRLVGEKVTLSLSHDPDLSPVRADKRQLEQVLMNLVVNARDAMPEGGEIRIETENRTLSEPYRRDRAVVPVGDYVLVRVTDAGSGIPSDKMHKIFEPFYSTKKVGEGTGLGLSTAYGIVKQTGGYIFADSVVGSGTTFTLFFPVFEGPMPGIKAPAADAAVAVMPRGEGVVLLVEDEAPVRAFASRALQLRGYTVLEAECAEDALTMLEDADLKVDVFVTDVIMPGMDGPSWVRQALKNRPEAKVVFVSGYAEDNFTDEQSRIPNSVFLPKPFSLNQLTATVHDQIH